MTREEHMARHEELHKAFDELLADYIIHTGSRPSTIDVTDMLAWSYRQTFAPDHPAEPAE